MPDTIRPVKSGPQDRSTQFNGFAVTETVRRPGQVLSRHSHGCTNIGLVLEGTFVETISGRPILTAPGSFTVLPACESHSDHYDREESRSLIIELEPWRLNLIRETANIPEHVTHFRNETVLLLGRRLQRELRTQDSASPLAIEALLMELLALGLRCNFSERASIASSGLRYARELIHARFCSNLGLAEIAEAANMHPSHLAKMFRRYYGSSVGEYIRRLRLEFAADQLTRSDQELLEIALAAGFYDQSHFTNAFKLHFGITPSAYRNSVLRGKKHTKVQ